VGITCNKMTDKQNPNETKKITIINVLYSVYCATVIVCVAVYATRFSRDGHGTLHFALCSGGFRNGRERLTAPWRTVKMFLNVDNANNDTDTYILYSYLPERRCLIYNLRERSHHNRSLITKTTYLNEHDFFIRILYKNCY